LFLPDTCITISDNHECYCTNRYTFKTIYIFPCTFEGAVFKLMRDMIFAYYFASLCYNRQRLTVFRVLINISLLLVQL